MTNFDKNTLKFDKINNPSPPDRSDQTKVYYDGKELKKVDYNGQVSPLVPEVNLVSAEADVTPDGFEYKISIPNPNKLIEQLKATVSELENNVNKLDIEINKKISDEIVTINSLISNLDATTEAALSSFEENVAASIENILSIIATDEELIRDKEDKLKAEERYTLIKSEIGELSTLINVQRELVDALRVEVNNKLEAKATSVDLQGGLSSIRKEIPVIRSGSNNVTVNKSGSVYTISVSVPEVTQRVVEKVASGASGITKSRVEKLIQEALEGFVGGKEITSNDGSVTIVETDTTIDLSVDISGGSGFIPLAGEGITIIPVGDDYQFAVDDYISSSEVASISGDLQEQIDNIIQEGTTIDSSGGSILVTQDGLHFNLEVASAPIANHNDLTGIQGGEVDEYYHLSEQQYNDYIGSSEVADLTASLQIKFDDYVPYTGATQDVDLGLNNLSANKIELDEDNSSLLVRRSNLGTNFIDFERVGAGGYRFHVSSAGGNLANWRVVGPNGSNVNMGAWRTNDGPNGSTFSTGSAIYCNNVGIEFSNSDNYGRFFGDLLTIAANTSVQGDVTISGDLVVNGNEFITNTETVSAADNIIVVNAGEVGSGVTKGYGGIRVDRGSLDDYFFVYDENREAFVLGVATDETSGALSQTQVAATREDNPINGGIAVFNGSERRFDTSTIEDLGIATTDDITGVESQLGDYTLLTTTEAISSNLQSQIDEIEKEQTVLIGGDGIEVIEDPTHTWTVSVSGDFANNKKIENITNTTSITEFDKVYSLQGSNSYTVTLPEANSSNLNKIVTFYKEGNSDVNESITLQTTSSQEINANKKAYTQVGFRFTGEMLTLISHGDHWDVIGESNLFANTVPVENEIQFINAINKLNFLGGGSVMLTDVINLTQDWTIDLGVIRVFGDSGNRTRINFNNHVLTITGSGFYFDSVRFFGERNLNADPLTTSNQLFLKLEVDDTTRVHSGKFENCVFRNLVGETEGSNIECYKTDGGFGYNITMTDCDIITAAVSDALGLTFEITNPSSSTHALNFFNVFAYNHRRQSNGFNRIRLISDYDIFDNNTYFVTDSSMLADTSAANNAFFNFELSATKELVAYNVEKTTIDDADDLLIHDKDSDELRRISFSNLTAELATQDDISDFITTSEVAVISGDLQTQINEIEEEQTIVVGGEGIGVVEDPTHTWTVSVTGEYLTEADISDFITTSEVAGITGDFVLKSGDDMTGKLTITTEGEALQVNSTGDAVVRLNQTSDGGYIEQTWALNDNDLISIYSNASAGTKFWGVYDYELDDDIITYDIINQSILINPPGGLSVVGDLKLVDSKDAILTGTFSRSGINFDPTLLFVWEVTIGVKGINYITLERDNVDDYVNLHAGVRVLPLEGNTDEIVTLGADGKLQASGTTVADLSGQNHLSYFEPFVIDSTPELVSISGSEYYTEIQQSYGNLIAVDADVGTYEEIEVRISSEWTSSQVGTFRLDLDVKSGQTFTFDNSIEGIADVELPASGVASLLFDKPYGTSTWHVRQSI